jgi:hypothetical protein
MKLWRRNRISLQDAAEWILAHKFETASFAVAIATIAVFGIVTIGGDEAGTSLSETTREDSVVSGIEPTPVLPVIVSQAEGKEAVEESAQSHEEGVQSLETLLRSQVSVSVQKDTTTQFAGNILKGGRAIGQFEIEEILGRTASVVKLGEDRFEMAEDANTGEFTLDGHNMLITEEKLADIKAASVALRESVPKNETEFDAKKGHLIGQVAWLASTHAGFIVGKHSSSIPRTEKSEVASYSYGEDGVKCINSYLGKNLTAYIRYYDQPWPSTHIGYRADTYTVQWCRGMCGALAPYPDCELDYRDGRFMDCWEHDVCTIIYNPSGGYWRCDANIWYTSDDFWASAWHPTCN